MNMTKVAYIFGTLDLQSTCDKWVAAAHYGKLSLMLRPGAGAPAPAPGLRRSGAYCNGCLRQPMRPFFYCDSHESQQRGKTPKGKFVG